MNDNPGTFAWAFANSNLRKIFGTKKDATETREYCITRSIMSCTLHQISLYGQVKNNEMSIK
jgi:hypothetical protein